MSDLESKTQVLIENFTHHAKLIGIPFGGCFAGGMFGFFFSEKPVQSFEDITNDHVNAFSKFHAGMLKKGILFAPSAYEASLFHILIQKYTYSTLLKLSLRWLKIFLPNK